MAVTLSSVTTVYSARPAFLADFAPLADYGTFSFSANPAVNANTLLEVSGDGARAATQTYAASFALSSGTHFSTLPTSTRIRESGGMVTTGNSLNANAKVTLADFYSTDPLVINGAGATDFDKAIAFGIDVLGTVGVTYNYTANFGSSADPDNWVAYTGALTIPAGGTGFVGFISPAETLQRMVFSIPVGNNISFDNLLFGEAVPFSPAGSIGAGIAAGLLWLRRKRA